MDMDSNLRTERTMRAMKSVLQTLDVLNDKLDDPQDIDTRVDMLLLSERIADASYELMNRAREIAWRDGANGLDG